MPKDPAFLDKVARIKAEASAPKVKPTAEASPSPGPAPIADSIDHLAAHARPRGRCNPPTSHEGWWVDGVCSSCKRAPGEA